MSRLLSARFQKKVFDDNRCIVCGKIGAHITSGRLCRCPRITRPHHHCKKHDLIFHIELSKCPKCDAEKQSKFSAKGKIAIEIVEPKDEFEKMIAYMRSTGWTGAPGTVWYPRQAAMHGIRLYPDGWQYSYFDKLKYEGETAEELKRFMGKSGLNRFMTTPEWKGKTIDIHPTKYLTSAKKITGSWNNYNSEKIAINLLKPTWIQEAEKKLEETEKDIEQQKKDIYDPMKVLPRPGQGSRAFDRPEPEEITAAKLPKTLLPAALMMGLSPGMIEKAPPKKPVPVVEQKRNGLDELIEAIRRAEGAKPELNNPGNLVDFNTGEIKQYDTYEEGEAALKEQLERIANGDHPNIKPDMSLRDAGLVYSGGDPNWSKNVSKIMHVPEDVPIVHLIKGVKSKVSATYQNAPAEIKLGDTPDGPIWLRYKPHPIEGESNAWHIVLDWTYPDQETYPEKIGEVRVGFTDSIKYPSIRDIYIKPDYRKKGWGVKIIKVLSTFYGGLTSDPLGYTNAAAVAMWQRAGGEKVPTDKNLKGYYWQITARTHKTAGPLGNDPFPDGAIDYFEPVRDMHSEREIEPESKKKQKHIDETYSTLHMPGMPVGASKLSKLFVALSARDKIPSPADARDALQLLKDWSLEYGVNWERSIDRTFKDALQKAQIKELPLDKLQIHYDWGRRPKSKKPIFVAEDLDGNYIVLDGQHRILVAKEAGESTISGWVIKLPLRKVSGRRRGYHYVVEHADEEKTAVQV